VKKKRGLKQAASNYFPEPFVSIANISSSENPEKARSRQRSSWRVRLSTIAALALLLGGCLDSPDHVTATYDVGIWAGTGSSPTSVRATFEAVRASGFIYDTLTAAELIGGTGDVSIYRYKMIIFPDGDQRAYSEYLGGAGRAIIRDYVAGGGGFIGFGAGGGLAGADSLTWPGIGIIPATTDYPISQIATPPVHTLTDVFRTEDAGDVLGSNAYRSLYTGGPQFFPFTNYRLWVSYRYHVTGGAAAITALYRNGRVFVTGFQPEYEEGSMRDSTNFADELPDPESEWELIRLAIAFCVER